MGLDRTGTGQGNSKLCGQDALVWDVPEPVPVLSDGKMGLDSTASEPGNNKVCGQDALVWDLPELVSVLSDG